MSSRSAIRALGIALLMAAVAGALWVGWQVWQVNRDLRSSVEDASALRSALEAGDQPSSQAAVDRLEEHTGSAAERTRGVTWSVLTRVPWFGDDARGVRLVADVANDLTVKGLAPLVADASDLEAMLPQEGRVPLDALVSLQEPVSKANGAFADADERLRDEDPASFVGPVKSKYRDLVRRVADAADALSSADVALQLLPGMLGEDGPRNYLLVFQNNAEVRATGGLPGAVSVLRADAGALTLTRQVTAASFGVLDEPVLPLSDAERQIYGDQLGVFFQDANFTPDYPRTAELMKARWEQVYDDKLDGVLSIDPVALSYLLGATGPVQVGGVTLTEENAVRELLHEPYLRYEDPVDQDEFFRQVARGVFDHVTSGVGDPRALMRALVRAGEEHRLYLHSFDSAEQSLITGRGIAGELQTEAAAGPHVGIYLNDATGSKMSYFLRVRARVDVTSCAGGVQTLDGIARLRSDAPPDAGTTLPASVTGGGKYGTEPGSQLVAVRIYAPVDGTIEQVILDGKLLRDIEIVLHERRQVATSFVLIKPQQTIDLTWRMRAAAGQTGDVTVNVTPGIEPRDSWSTATSVC